MEKRKKKLSSYMNVIDKMLEKDKLVKAKYWLKIYTLRDLWVMLILLVKVNEVGLVPLCISYLI